MRRTIAASIVAALAWAIAACGGSDTGGGRGGEGAACVDGSNCEHGLFCWVQNDDPAGICAKLPASCGGKPSCNCLTDYDAQCTSCYGFVGEYVLGCSESGPFKQEGEACSYVIHCESGLFCFIAATGKAGTCKKNPSACVPLGCSCFDSVREACASGSGCMTAGDTATISCS